MPVSVVQSHPKLNAVQFSRLRRGCFFRVGDAVSGRHQVKFSRMQKALTTRAVIVQDFTREQPRYGLKANVRMRSNVHRFAESKTHRSEAVKEAPRTNHAALADRQNPSNRHGANLGPTCGERFERVARRTLSARRFCRK